jgi:hypothetical protein
MLLAIPAPTFKVLNFKDDKCRTAGRVWPYSQDHGCYHPRGQLLRVRGRHNQVVSRRFWTIPLLLAAALCGASSDYLSAKRKFDQIESDRLRAGTRVELTARELTAYVQQEIPAGVRNARLQLPSPGVAVGSAVIDFAQLRRGQGHPPGWLMSKLLEGERPVSVTARIHSGDGQAKVDVERVEISGVVIDGKTLDFLIQNFLIPLYPDAVVGRPFELGHRINKLDVQPAAVGVVIGQ